MKAYVLHGINDLRLENIDIPVAKEGEALIRVMAAGICGSDIPRIYETGAHVHPIVLGHEFSGVVERVGNSKDAFWVGKRVGVFPLIPCRTCQQCKRKQFEMCRNYNYLGSRCDGGFAEYVKVPIENIIELPDEVSFEQAAMLEPFSVAAHAVRGLVDGNTSRNSKVVVWGMGTIGIMVTLILKNEGFDNLFCVCNKNYQRELLINKVGICSDSVFSCNDIDDISEFTQSVENGFDLCFECVGKTETVANLVKIASPGAKLMLIGNPYSDMMLKREEYWMILRNQLTVKGTWNSSFTNDTDDDWHYVLRFFENNPGISDFLVTHKYSFKDLSVGIGVMRNKTENYIKCMYCFKEDYDEICEFIF